MRLEPPLSPCAMVVCALYMLMMCGACLSFWLGVNGKNSGLHFTIISFILMLCALIVNLLTMMQIFIPMMIFLMNAILDLML